MSHFCRTNWLIQKNVSKHMGNLVKPKGNPKNRQSSLNKILELATASPTNLILETLPIFRLLWL